MKFTNNLYSALADITKVVPAENVSLKAKDGRLRLHVQSVEDNVMRGYAATSVKGDGEEEWETTCSASILMKALAGRKDVELTFSEEIKIVAGRYKASLATQAYEKPIAKKPEEGTAVSEKIMDSLLDCLDKVSITGVINEKQAVLLHYVINSEGVKAASSDENHGIYFQCNEPTSKKEMSFSIPSTYYSSLSMFKGQETNLFITDKNQIHAWSKRMHLVLPLIQGGGTFKSVSGVLSPYASSLKKASTFNSNNVAKVVDNMSAIYDEITSIVFTFKEGKLKMSCRSSLGEISETIKVEGECVGEIKIDHVPAEEIIGKFEESSDVQFVFMRNPEGKINAAIFVEDIFSTGKVGKKIGSYVYLVKGQA